MIGVILLGLRLIKLTVNFDDPGVHHLPARCAIRSQTTYGPPLPGR